MDGTIEARPEMKDLLDRVRQGETLTLTEGGVPVARVVPAPDRPVRSEEQVRELLARFRDFASRHTLGGLSICELIDEGKR